MTLKLFAPNIHTGGGLVLLKSLLDEWPHYLHLVAWIDIRAKGRITFPPKSDIIWVKPSFKSRLGAEISLLRHCCAGEKVLFLHGLPPLFPIKAKAFVFLQNRNFISKIRYSSFSHRTRMRLFFERTYGRLFSYRVDVYFVQTRSMAATLRDWFGSDNIDVRISPFAPPMPDIPGAQQKKWDFLYISDGEAHKNHRTLVEAWKILAQQHLYPSLALTLSERDHRLHSWINSQKNFYGLTIINLGTLPHDDILELYGKVSALIFPSTSESFGLPLLEASVARLPILAGELDFVRDVCDPVESFDPNSAISIARAVRRFLQSPERPMQVLSAGNFIDIVRSVD